MVSIVANSAAGGRSSLSSLSLVVGLSPGGILVLVLVLVLVQVLVQRLLLCLLPRRFPSSDLALQSLSLSLSPLSRLLLLLLLLRRCCCCCCCCCCARITALPSLILTSLYSVVLYSAVLCVGCVGCVCFFFRLLILLFSSFFFRLLPFFRLFVGEQAASCTIGSLKGNAQQGKKKTHKNPGENRWAAPPLPLPLPSGG